MGKSWGKTSQKSTKNYTNVQKNIPPIFIDKSVKNLNFTKLQKPSNVAHNPKAVGLTFTSVDKTKSQENFKEFS